MSPIFAGCLEIIGQPIYDCVHLPGGWTKSTPFQMFDYPVGTLRPTMKAESPWEMTTFHHTNLLQRRSLVAPNRFCVRCVRVAFLRDHAIVDLADPIWRKSLVEFRINRKTYLEASAAMLCDPAALVVPSAWKDWPPELRREFAEQSAGNRYLLSRDGCWIDAMQEFELRLTAPDPYSDTDFVVLFEGDYARAIQ